MSYVPDVNLFGMLSSLGDTIGNDIKQYRQGQYLSQLGGDLANNDYAAAMQRAFQNRDLNTGLSLAKLGQDQAADAKAMSLAGFNSNTPAQVGGGAPSGALSQGVRSMLPTFAKVGGEYGLSPDYLPKVAQIESGGNWGATNPNSGAAGGFQFVPSTARAYGLTNPNDPNASTVAAARLAADNRTALTKGLGRDPTDAELYLAHQQGAGGALKMLRDPNGRAVDTVGYNAVVQNGGRPDMTNAQFANLWTSKYARTPGAGGQPVQVASNNPGFVPGAMAYAPAARQMAAAAPAPAADTPTIGDDDYAGPPQVSRSIIPSVANGRPTAEGVQAVQSQPGPVQPTKAAPTATTDSARQSLLAKQANLTQALYFARSDGAKAMIKAQLDQVGQQLKDAKDSYDIRQLPDGSFGAINKADPSQPVIPINTGTKPKSQAEYDQRKVIADDQGLEGEERKQFLLNGKLPDPRVLKPQDILTSGSGSTLATNTNASTGGARSAIGMYMQRFLQEHPDATADDVARATQNFQAQGTGLSRFTSGPQGNTVRSFNVLVDHLGTLNDAVGALGNGNTKLFNKIGQMFAEQTGGTAPTNFDATKALVGDEIIKAIVGAGGSLADREEAKATLDRANSPQQLAGVIDQYRKLAVGQLHGLRYQYRSATGRDDFDRLLSPGTLNYFNGASPAGHPAAPAPPTSAKSQSTVAPQFDVSQAKQAPDGNWYVPDPARPGKFLQVVH